MTVTRKVDGTARLVLGRVELRAADGVILASLAVFSLLAVGGKAAVEGWPLLVARNLCVCAAVLISAAVTPRIRRPLLAFLLRTATVTLSYAYLFSAVAGLQLILHGRFRDDLVLAFEARLFGVQPTLWMERFITPFLTEWMMFCYVIYVPLYPVLCAILWVKRGEAGGGGVLLHTRPRERPVRHRLHPLPRGEPDVLDAGAVPRAASRVGFHLGGGA